MKKIIISIIQITLILILLTPMFSYASETNFKVEISKTTQTTQTTAQKSDGLGDLNSYKSNPSDMGTLKNKAETVLSIISTIGIFLSVIALIVIGIKYMTASIEQKAEYKRTLIPYLIGAILVFTVSALPNFIYKIVITLERQ